jgi:Cu/Ag efflux protein CusF
MKKLMIAASAAALFATMSLAYAAEATGTISSVDTASGTVTLDNGSTYALPTTVAAADLKIGSKVTITYDNANGKMTATAVVPAS